MTSTLRLLSMVGGLVGVGACSLVGDYEDYVAETGAGGSSTTSTATTGTGTSTSTSTGGGTGTGGAGGGPECAVASDCPAPASACEVAACEAGSCGSIPLPLDTAVPQQIDGDCKVSRCDGNGNVVDANDDGDLPDDLNECTDDVCTAGVVSNPGTAAGTLCGLAMDLACDGAGQCTGCTLASQCGGVDDACKTKICTTAVCGFSFTAAGALPMGSQIVGDCQTAGCDGAGVITSTDDTSDVDDDADDCTQDLCAGSPSAPVNPDEPLDTACGMSGVCNATGTCVECNGAATCGTDVFCQTFACMTNTCMTNNTAMGTALPPGSQIAGDCKSAICSGTGAMPTTQADNTDSVADANECTIEGCTSGNPSTSNATINTVCTFGGGFFCDGAGNCVECNNNAQCTGGETCQNETCVPAACNDLVKNGTETDVDCGGGGCPDCSVGDSCLISQDCRSGLCSGMVCVAVCGNGLVDGTELCDDGKTTACGDCNANCTAAGTGGNICGDGVQCSDVAAEACDDGKTTACGACNATCTGAGTGGNTCGDGITCSDDATPEFCDDGRTTACGVCNATCTAAGTGGNTCGDGSVCTDVFAETCDDGKTTACGACNATCTGAGTGGQTCGDGIVCADVTAETCDDFNANVCGSCNASCSGAGTGTCANGVGCVQNSDCTSNTCRCGTCRATATLFFSEYVEGTSGGPVNRALEIFNPTNAAFDLSGCSVRVYYNGDSFFSTSITLSGTLAVGDVHVLCDDNGSAALLALCDQQTSSSLFSGNDAIELFCGSRLDVIGQIGNNPGSGEWGSGLTSTQDNTLRRNSGIVVGDTNAGNSFNPATEWQGFAIDTFSGLGSHTLCP